MCEKPFTDFNFWGFKYHLICKIRLKLSTFFDFILSWSWKISFYYPFQRAGGTPTVPWVMAYPRPMGFYKIYRSSVLLLQPYWNALLTQHILDIFCCVKWRKSFWYPFQWARWVSTVPWVMSYQPSMSCHNKSRPEITYWTAGNVVATKFYAHAEESIPWVMELKKTIERG